MGVSIAQTFHDKVTAISADALYPVGTVRHENGKKYVYQQADDAITQYDYVILDVAASATGKKVVSGTDTTDMIFGVAEVAVTDEYYFWCTVGGPATVLAATGLSAGDTLGASAATGVMDAVSTRDPFGILLVANSSGSAAARAIMLFNTVGSACI